MPLNRQTLTQLQEIKLGCYIGEAELSLMKYDPEAKEFIKPTAGEVIQSAYARLEREFKLIIE